MQINLHWAADKACEKSEMAPSPIMCPPELAQTPGGISVAEDVALLLIHYCHPPSPAASAAAPLAPASSSHD